MKDVGEMELKCNGCRKERKDARLKKKTDVENRKIATGFGRNNQKRRRRTTWRSVNLLHMPMAMCAACKDSECYASSAHLHSFRTP